MAVNCSTVNTALYKLLSLHNHPIPFSISLQKFCLVCLCDFKGAALLDRHILAQLDRRTTNQSNQSVTKNFLNYNWSTTDGNYCEGNPLHFPS